VQHSVFNAKVSDDCSSHSDHSTDTASKIFRDSCTAFVSNLDYSVTREQLVEMFSKVRLQSSGVVLLGKLQTSGVNLLGVTF